MNSQSRSLADYVTAARRRRVPAIVAAVSVLVIAVAAAIFWPPTYRSTGIILIEQQEVPVDLVRSMVSSYADQRIQMISQRVMTSDNLMRIIDRYQLYPDKRRTEPREALLNRMRDDIRFSMISADVVDPRSGRPVKATIAFSVSYDSGNPTLAAKVANEITTLYLNENLESRRQTADDTATFLTAEGDRLSKQIDELDGRLAAFKEQNVNNLPELSQLNMQMMNRAEEELRETETRIRSLDQQIVYLDAQLAQLTPAAQIYTETGQRILSPSDRLKTLKSEYARASAIYAPTHPDILRMQREIDGLEREVGRVDTANDLARQLSDAQSQLASAREKYAPDHPEVKQLERMVASLESVMRTAPLTSEAVRADADNPAYIQVSAQREASSNERRALEKKTAALRAKIAEYEQRLSESPEIAREYSAIARELENAQLKYREVRQKQMEATLSRNLETERKGERFTLIEPPMAAEEPVSPYRTAILLMGMVLSLGAAVGIVLLLEALDTSIRSRRDIEALVAVPPLAVLPWIETPAERTGKTRVRRLSLAGAATSFVVAVVMIHFLYRPLDVLWAVAWRRFFG
ncbi:LPS biosynthesis protein [Steroidobacter agaridevorans]|uniref:LPS biosynthesis protein n=1 Tax=Steroidobacter agaridevorans TaxID=2695856 RepID=A0A829YNJ4_9GAMM|nr:lipopolysaccharide biosynthesis protein [Steroidobacter agaridevorans]GFE84248.1 LPS biosynthesis protein [Steroidobacter agaridevorans]